MLEKHAQEFEIHYYTMFLLTKQGFKYRARALQKQAL